ncbi:MAG: hypothetical protein ABJD11_18940 [Gemmatimonadota bacterium]
MRVYRAQVAAGILLLVLVSRMPAQMPGASLHLSIGFAVDTMPTANREIFTLWRRYLSAELDSVRATMWSSVERARWRGYDLVGNAVYNGFSTFTVVRLAPAISLDSTYVIQTLVTSVDDSTRDVSPLALYRVYAVREAGHWVLANALPRITRTWHHETIGPITFIFPPGQEFSRRRAVATAAFADSLARAFDLPHPAPIEYFFTTDLGETLRAMGLDFYPLGSDTIGGRSNAFTRQVFAGASSNAESYRHELAHIILQPVLGPEAPGAVVEGLMTWTGGSAGIEFKGLLPGLEHYLEAHPELTLQDVMVRPPLREGSLDVAYDGFAVLCRMIYERGGMTALRGFLTAGRTQDEVLGGAAKLLMIPRASLDQAWRGWIAKQASAR